MWTLVRQERRTNSPLDFLGLGSPVSPGADQFYDAFNGALDPPTTKDPARQGSSVDDAELSEFIEYSEEIHAGHEEMSAVTDHSGVVPFIGLFRGAENLKPFRLCPAPKGRLALVHLQNQHC